MVAHEARSPAHSPPTSRHRRNCPVPLMHLPIFRARIRLCSHYRDRQPCRPAPGHRQEGPRALETWPMPVASPGRSRCAYVYIYEAAAGHARLCTPLPGIATTTARRRLCPRPPFTQGHADRVTSGLRPRRPAPGHRQREQNCTRISGQPYALDVRGWRSRTRPCSPVPAPPPPGHGRSCPMPLMYPPIFLA